MTDGDRLLSFPFSSSSNDSDTVRYQPWTPEEAHSRGLGIFDATPAMTVPISRHAMRFVRHVFPTDSFKPIRLEINGRKGRRVVCVLDEGGQWYRVLDLADDD